MTQVSGAFVGVVFGYLVADAVDKQNWWAAGLLAAATIHQLWYLQRHWLAARRAKPPREAA